MTGGASGDGAYTRTSRSGLSDLASIAGLIAFSLYSALGPIQIARRVYASRTRPQIARDTIPQSKRLEFQAQRRPAFYPSCSFRFRYVPDHITADGNHHAPVDKDRRRRF